MAIRRPSRFNKAPVLCSERFLRGCRAAKDKLDFVSNSEWPRWGRNNDAEIDALCAAVRTACWGNKQRAAGSGEEVCRGCACFHSESCGKVARAGRACLASNERMEGAGCSGCGRARRQGNLRERVRVSRLGTET